VALSDVTSPCQGRAGDVGHGSRRPKTRRGRPGEKAADSGRAIANGADIVYWHDVKAMVCVVRMTDAIVSGRSPPG